MLGFLTHHFDGSPAWQQPGEQGGGETVAAGFLVGWFSFFGIYAGTIATLAAGFAAGLAPWLELGRASQLVGILSVEPS